MFLKVQSYLSWIIREFPLIISGPFQSGLKEEPGQGSGRLWASGLADMDLVPGSPYSSWVLEKLFTSGFLICKLGVIKYLFGRVLMRTK